MTDPSVFEKRLPLFVDEFRKEVWVCRGRSMDPFGILYTPPPKATITNRLTKKEFDILMCLVKNGTHTVSHDEIADAGWPKRSDAVPAKYIYQYIRRLREKIEEDPSTPETILTRVGGGYYIPMSYQLIALPDNFSWTPSELVINKEEILRPDGTWNQFYFPSYGYYYAILGCLIENRGLPLGPREIKAYIDDEQRKSRKSKNKRQPRYQWGNSYFVPWSKTSPYRTHDDLYPSMLAEYITNIRKQVEIDPSDPKIILTVEVDPSDPKIILPVKQTFRQQIARMFSKSLIEVRYMIPTAERAMGTVVT